MVSSLSTTFSYFYAYARIKAMNVQQLYYFAADTYSCDAYGSGSYNENACSTVGSPDSGVAPAYGSPYFIGGTALIVLAAALAVGLLIRRRRSHS